MTGASTCVVRICLSASALFDRDGLLRGGIINREYGHNVQSLCAYSLLNNFTERNPYEETKRQKQYFRIIPQDLPQARGHGSFRTVLRVADMFLFLDGSGWRACY